MNMLIDHLYKFDRRPVHVIYDMQDDFSFACMGRNAIALDLGFEAEQSGIVKNIVPHRFHTLEEAESFPWKVSLEGEYAQKELERFKEWSGDGNIHRGGGCFGPLTVAACIIGVEECTRMVIKAPDILQAVLRKVTDYMILLAKEEERLGAQSFWIAEPVASLLSPRACMRFCIPYIKEIYDAIDIPGVLHVCGNTDRHTPALVATGAQALSIDWCSDLAECIAQVPDDVVVMGNINPMVLWMGTREEVREETGRLLEQTRNYKNFIMATGCQVPGDAPRENVELMVEMTKNAPIRSNDQYRAIARLANIYCSGGEAAFEQACADEGAEEDVRLAAADVAQKRLDILARQKKHI